MLEFIENKVPPHWRDAGQRVAFSLWGSVAFVAVVFLARGWAGAFRRELPALAACVSAFVAACACLAALGFYRASVPGGFSRRQALLAFASTVLPPLLLGAVLCPVASSLGIAWITVLGVGLTMGTQGVATPARTSRALIEIEEDSRSETAPVASVFPAAFEEPDLTQWMTRRSLRIEGELWEQIEGQSTVEFAIGQQHATMHLSICPPLASTPEIECEVKGEANVEWKVTALHPYGVRLELRRPAPTSAPLAVAVGYTMAAQHQMNVAKAA